MKISLEFDLMELLDAITVMRNAVDDVAQDGEKIVTDFLREFGLLHEPPCACELCREPQPEPAPAESRKQVTGRDMFMTWTAANGCPYDHASYAGLMDSNKKTYETQAALLNKLLQTA